MEYRNRRKEGKELEEFKFKRREGKFKLKKKKLRTRKNRVGARRV